jgi:hypothetical protein
MICPRCGIQAGPDQQRCSRCAGSLAQPAPTDAEPIAAVVAPTRRGELQQAAEGTRTVSLVGQARARAAATPAPALPAPVAAPTPFPAPPAALGEPVGVPAAPPAVAPAPAWTAPEAGRPEAWPPPPAPWGAWPPPPAEPGPVHAGPVHTGPVHAGPVHTDPAPSGAAQSRARSARPAAPPRPPQEGHWPSPPQWGTPAPDRWNLARTLPTTYWWQAVVVFLLVPPVGAAALYFSWQVTRRADIGDWGGSVRASRLARTCCLLGAFVAALAVLILLAGNSK